MHLNIRNDSGNQKSKTERIKIKKEREKVTSLPGHSCTQEEQRNL